MSREFVEKTDAGSGRPSIGPVVFFKLQLVMFFEGMRSERQLMRHAADRLRVRWYIGYDYEAERDVYVCPAGKDLRFNRPHSTERSRR